MQATAPNPNNSHSTEDLLDLIDTMSEFVIVSRAGNIRKTRSGTRKNWFNVKNVKIKTMKSINFELFPEWEVVPNKTVLQTDLCSDIVTVKLAEVEKRKAYKVYDKVDDDEQEVVTTMLDS